MSRLYLQPSTLAKRLWPLLFILIGASYLWGLGSIPFVGPDEPRYAEVAREMFARGDWVTPTLGGLPWFEKPSLLYWMMMASYRLFGVSEFAARLGPALCGLLTAVFVYWIGRAIEPTTRVPDSAEQIQWHAIARWSALVYLSSLGTIVFSRGVNFDVVLTMTTTGALACFFIAESKSRESRGEACGLLSSLAQLFNRGSQAIFLGGFYFFAGLSLLAKGLAGYVIIFGSVSLYYLIRRERPRRQFLVSFLWGIPLSLAIAAIWYGPMIARHGYVFIDQFIIQHHFERFTTNKYHHPEPIYFYPLVVLVLVLPWTISLVAGWFSTRGWNWRGALPIESARVLALAWLIVPIAFFSISQSKLPGYILPVLPACSLLIGERIACFCRERRGEKVIRSTGVLLIALAVGGAWYTSRTYHAHRIWIAIAALPLLVGLIALALPKLRAPIFLLIGIAAIASSAMSLRFIAPTIAARESVRDMLRAADQRGYGGLPVVQLHTLERTAQYYAARRLTYGSDGEPVKFEGANQVLDAARRNGGQVLCLVPVKYLRQLIALPNARAEVVSDNGRVCLVVVTASFAE